MKISLFAVCGLLSGAFSQQPQVHQQFAIEGVSFPSREDLLCQNNRDKIVDMYGRVQPADLQPVVDRFCMMQCDENPTIPAIERTLIAKLARKSLSDDTK